MDQVKKSPHSHIFQLMVNIPLLFNLHLYLINIKFKSTISDSETRVCCSGWTIKGGGAESKSKDESISARMDHAFKSSQ
jgi:hypothetical protein